MLGRQAGQAPVPTGSAPGCRTILDESLPSSLRFKHWFSIDQDDLLLSMQLGMVLLSLPLLGLQVCTAYLVLVSMTSNDMYTWMVN